MVLLWSRPNLADKPVLNANVLDYLLARQELIPAEWKGKAVFFWGAIYRYPDGNLCVRRLYWFGDKRDRYCYWFDCGWCSDFPAACAQPASFLSRPRAGSSFIHNRRRPPRRRTPPIVDKQKTRKPGPWKRESHGAISEDRS